MNASNFNYNFCETQSFAAFYVPLKNYKKKCNVANCQII